MFRTRDFVLVLTTVAFLLTAIGVTVVSKWQASDGAAPALQPTTTLSPESSVVTENFHEFSRQAELQAMRDKIAASSELSIIAPKPVVLPAETTTTTATTTDSATSSSELATAQLCPGYQPANLQWSPYDIEIAELEGMRLVYRETQGATVVTASATPALPTVQRDVLAELPIRSFPGASPTCIATDVIGIATDGSLIRNDEVALYGIFGSTTLVGWALDGFPIYGSAPGSGDICGGMNAAAGYRYQISAERTTILNCFSATPIHL